MRDNKLRMSLAGGAAVLLILASVLPAPADEGLWLFNKFPFEIVKQRYGFTVTPEWLEHFRLSCVNIGGSDEGSLFLRIAAEISPLPG